MTGRRSAPVGRLLPLVAAMLLLSACPTDQPEDLNARDAAVYSTVIDDMVATHPVTTEDPETLPTVFVEAFDPEGIALEVQVELIANYEELYDLRFIDDRIEALDVELPDAPVRPESLLLGLGPVVDVEGVGVRAEIYSSETNVEAFFYSLIRGGGSPWSVLGDPEEVEAEGFGAIS